MRPPELEKPMVGATGSRPSNRTGRKAWWTSYRTGDVSASNLKLVGNESLGERALRRVVAEVQENPCRLPLAAHRIGGLVNSGKLPYRRAWDALESAALRAGAGSSWTRRCMFAAFAASNISELPTPTLWALANRGVE
jgi:hypothetical protein